MRALIIYKYLTDENPGRTEFTAREFDSACRPAIDRYGAMKPASSYRSWLDVLETRRSENYLDYDWAAEIENWVRTGGYDPFYTAGYVHPVLARLCKAPSHPKLQRRKDAELGVYVYSVTELGQTFITKYLES